MPRVTADDVLNYARSAKQRSLCTLHYGKPFSFRVVGDTLVFTISTDEERKHPRKYLERVCARFSQIGSYKPSDYKHKPGAIHACYTLPLIKAMPDASPAQAR